MSFLQQARKNILLLSVIGKICFKQLKNHNRSIMKEFISIWPDRYYRNSKHTLAMATRGL